MSIKALLSTLRVLVHGQEHVACGNNIVYILS